MPSKIHKHFDSSGKKHYLFGLDLINPTIKFKQDGSFRLKTETPSDYQHEWVSRDGTRGAVRGRHLAKSRRWRDYTADHQGRGDVYTSAKGLASERGLKDQKVIGAMPLGKGANLFMYEMDQIKHKGGDLVITGHVLSKDFMLDHSAAISATYGTSTLHNHLKFQKYLPEALKALEATSSARKSRRMKDAVRSSSVPGRPLAFWGSIGGALEDLGGAIEETANDAGEAIEEAANEASEVIVETGENVYNEAEEVVNELIDEVEGTYETVVSTAENLVDYAVYAYEWVEDLLTGAVDLSFRLTWDEIPLKYSKGPFSSKMTVQPSMEGKASFSRGFFVAATDPSTISFSFEPRVDLIGHVRLDLGAAGVGYSETFQGPSYTTAAPVIGQATVSTELDVDFEAGVSLGEDVGAIGATLSAAPAVAFKLSGTNVDFQDRSTPPDLTPDLGQFSADSLAPTAGMNLTVTPKVKFIAGPKLPGDIPYIGGMDLATLDMIIANPIPLTYDLSTPAQFDAATSANATSQFNFMGARVSPQLMNEPLYGPETVSIQV